MAWVTGQRLQTGKYTIEGVLGVGGFGITYLARDSDGFPVVIKTLNETAQRHAQFEQLQQDFVNEAVWLAKCAHPHIVQIHRVFQESGLWCMVMEYIAGENLANRVKHRGVLNEAEALRYVQQIADALVLMHQTGLLHRDVKPENIMLRAGKAEAVLLDLGIAREFTPNSTQNHTAILSNGYAPIEQYEYQARRGAYSDVYGLSATLYFLLTGETPKDAQVRAYTQLRHGTDPLEHPKHLNPHVSDRTNRAVLAGMAIESKDRPQSVQEWLGLLPINSSSSESFSVGTNPLSVTEAVEQSPTVALAGGGIPRFVPPHSATLPLPASVASPQPDPEQTRLPRFNVSALGTISFAQKLGLITAVALVSVVAGMIAARWFANQRAEAGLAEVETLKQAGNYEACIEQAARLPKIQPAYNDAQALGNECAEAILNQARELAGASQYKEALQEAVKIPMGSTVYQTLEPLIAQWSEELVKQATRLYQEEGKLDEAIAMLETIPESAPAHEKTEETIAQWQEEWDKNQTAFQAAQQALEQGAWYDAADKVAALTTPYWQNRAESTRQEAESQIAAIEAEDRRRAEEEAQQSPEELYAAAYERCQANEGGSLQENCQEFEQLCEAQGGTFVADATYVGCTSAVEPNKTPKSDEPPKSESSPSPPGANAQPTPSLIVPIPGDR